MMTYKVKTKPEDKLVVMVVGARGTIRYITVIKLFTIKKLAHLKKKCYSETKNKENPVLKHKIAYFKWPILNRDKWDRVGRGPFVDSWLKQGNRFFSYNMSHKI